MTTTPRPRKHILTTLRARRDSSRVSDDSARRLRPQLIADGVIAGYIHDISVRHRRFGQVVEPTPAPA